MVHATYYLSDRHDSLSIPHTTVKSTDDLVLSVVRSLHSRERREGRPDQPTERQEEHQSVLMPLNTFLRVSQSPDLKCLEVELCFS